MLKSKVSLMAAVLALLGLGAGSFIMACGDDNKPATPVASNNVKPAVAAAPVAAPAAPAVAVPLVSPKDGSISGVVTIKGDIKKRKKIKMDADPKCSAMHAEPPLMEDIVADDAGHVQWAFVYVKKGAEGKKPAKETPAVINQVGCHYEPHVLGIVVGQELTIKNSDDLLHNIHALPFSNKEFNFGQPTKGLEEKKTFSTQEVMVKVKCDVHPWMSAWIGVLDHGFFGVTDAAGKYVIPAGLADGKYTVEVWHEGYKNVSAEVEVKGGAGAANFDLTEKRE